MNPLFLAIVALGAWYVGKSGKRRTDRVPVTEPDTKIPEIPKLPPLPGPGGPEGSAGPGQWDSVGFGVEVYPSGADHTQTSPPSSSSGVVWSPGCEVIVVGDDWWERVGDYLEAAVAQGVNDAETLRDLVIEAEGLDVCPSTAASAAMFDEIKQRVGDALLTQAVSVTAPAGGLMTEVEQEFGAGAHVHIHYRKNVGNHKIIVSPHSNYYRWWAFRPFDELTQEGAFAKGSKYTPEMALQAGKRAVNSYTAVVGNKRRRRNGSLSRLILW